MRAKAGIAATRPAAFKNALRPSCIFVPPLSAFSLAAALRLQILSKERADATAANASLTLSAVGSAWRRNPAPDGHDVVCAKEILSSGSRGATTLPARQGAFAWPLHAARPARIPLPDHQYVAGRPRLAGARHRQCRRP